MVTTHLELFFQWEGHKIGCSRKHVGDGFGREAVVYQHKQAPSSTGITAQIRRCVGAT